DSPPTAQYHPRPPPRAADIDAGEAPLRDDVDLPSRLVGRRGAVAALPVRRPAPPRLGGRAAVRTLPAVAAPVAPPRQLAGSTAGALAGRARRRARAD